MGDAMDDESVHARAPGAGRRRKPWPRMALAPQSVVPAFTTPAGTSRRSTPPIAGASTVVLGDAQLALIFSVALAEMLYAAWVPFICPRCSTLWETYYETSIKQFRALEELTAATLEHGEPALIARLTEAEGSLSKALAVASAQVVAHRAT